MGSGVNRDVFLKSAGEALASEARVNADDLWVSGASVEGHAALLHQTHVSAESRIDAALSGLPGMAATAMVAKSADWEATTAALTGQLADQAAVYRSSAAAYVESDESNADEIRQVGASASVSSLRLQ